MIVYQLVNPDTGTRGPLYEAENTDELLDQCQDTGVSVDTLVILLLTSTPTGEVYASQAPLVKISTLIKQREENRHV